MQWFYLDPNQQQVPADENDLGGLVQAGSIQADTLLWNETLSDWQPAATLFPTWFPEPAQAQPVAEAQPAAGPKLVAGKPASIGMVKRPIKTGAGGKPTGPTRTGNLGRPRAGGGAVATAGGGAQELAEEGGGQEETELVRDMGAVLAANGGWMKFLGVMMIIMGILNCLTVIGALFGWIPIWLGVVLNRAAGAASRAQMRGDALDLEESLDRVGFFFKLQGILILIVLILYVLLIVAALASGVLAGLMSGAAMAPME